MLGRFQLWSSGFAFSHSAVLISQGEVAHLSESFSRCRSSLDATGILGYWTGARILLAIQLNLSAFCPDIDSSYNKGVIQQPHDQPLSQWRANPRGQPTPVAQPPPSSCASSPHVVPYRGRIMDQLALAPTISRPGSHDVLL